MDNFRDKLIQDLYDLNVHADITIEELADDIIDAFNNIGCPNIMPASELRKVLNIE